jgi:chromosome segregation ATPase
MKTKIVVAFLAVASAGLAIALFVTKNRSDEQHKTDLSSIEDLTKQLVSVRQTNSELSDINIVLNRDLATNQVQIAALSNSLVGTEASLTDSHTALSNAQDQITGLNTRITDLEKQNNALDQRATELTGAITQLNAQIADTRGKLATSENNNTYLQQQLQKQMAEKAELEHKFNDLDALRQQVKKIKTDMYIARRLQLMKNDIAGKKGAELLIAHQPAETTAPAAPSYGLNVEVGSDGSVKIMPPVGATNAPAR